jgi:hypothetical protein
LAAYSIKGYSQQKVLCNWGMTLKQSSAVHIQALVSADGILPGSSSKLRLLVINLASVPGRQLVNSPTAQSLERYMQYQMNLKLLLVIFVLSALSCRQSSNKKNEITIIETTMAPIKQDYTISWSDSGKVEFKLNELLTYPKIYYDSAKILFYMGYNLGEGLDTESYFPLNDDGEWISTIMRSSIISKTDLWKVDSLLGNQKSYDESTAAGRLAPKYGIVYFKNGKVIGQTCIDPGGQTVKTTFKLPQPSYSQRLNNSECRQIEVVFAKKFHLYGM